jgi:hypothetical protein
MKNYVITFDFHDDSFREDFKSTLTELGFANMDDNQTTFFGTPDQTKIGIPDENTMERVLKEFYEKLKEQRAHKRDKVSFYFPTTVGYVPMIRHQVVIDREQ